MARHNTPILLKRTKFYLIFPGIILGIISSVSSAVDYCEGEIFEASCPSNQVVAVSSAKYGRMRYGRCIRRNYGYLGCQSDVLSIVQGRCSGQRSCQIGIPDAGLEATTPCPRDLKSYLEVSYACIDASSTEYCEGETFEATCPSNQAVAVYSAKYGRMRLGRCIKADLGYLGCQSDVLSIVQARCSGQRSCQIHVPDPSLEETNPCHHELKSYLEVTYGCIDVMMGCPSLSIEGAAIDNQDNEAHVTCLYQDKTWSLRCNGTHWEGATTECSQTHSLKTSGKAPHQSGSPIYAVTFVGSLLAFLSW